VSRRPLLPGAAELFRSTIPPVAKPGANARPDSLAAMPRGHAAPPTPRVGTGRQKHDAKITVYVSGEELVALEQARLSLRAQHGLGVDRGRIVREAVAVLLADLDEHGESSMLVRRLRDGSA
jgi:hypothetical protein